MTEPVNTKGLTTQQIIDTRSFLAANVDTVLEHISILREDQKNESDDLFGGMEDARAGIVWKQSMPLSSFEVLLNEGESLGLFVSGNPLEKYAPFVEWLRSNTFRDDIFLVLFNKVRKIFTKKNLMMFAIEVSTLDEDYEAIIFPKNALKYSPMLVEKELYWVKGKISHGKGKKKKEEKATADGNADAATDDDMQAPVEEETPEYEEKPKIIIDGLTKFEDGVLSLFENEDLGFAKNRQNLIESIQWSQIKNNPTAFQEYIGDSDIVPSQQQTGAGSHSDLTTSQNIHMQPKTLKLAQSLGKDTLRKVKEMLSKTPVDNGVAVEVAVQTSAGWKKAKGVFYIDLFLLHSQGILVEIE